MKYRKTRKVHTLLKKEYGGAILGSGAFGSVFDPPMKCLNLSDDITKPGYVTKAMYIDNPIKDSHEMYIANVIRSNFKKDFIDKYLIIPERQCQINRTIYNTEVSKLNYYSLEKTPEPKNKPNILLWMKKADGTINDIMIMIWDIKDCNGFYSFLERMNVKTISEFQRRVEKAFDGLKYAIKQLHKKHIYHNDIDPEERQKWLNIMYVFENNSMSFKLIDFGIAEIYPYDGKIDEEEEFKREREIESIDDLKEFFIEQIKEAKQRANITNTKSKCTIMGGKRKTKKQANCN